MGTNLWLVLHNLPNPGLGINGKAKDVSYTTVDKNKNNQKTWADANGEQSAVGFLSPPPSLALFRNLFSLCGASRLEKFLESEPPPLCGRVVLSMCCLPRSSIMSRP